MGVGGGLEWSGCGCKRVGWGLSILVIFKCIFWSEGGLDDGGAVPFSYLG